MQLIADRFIVFDAIDVDRGTEYRAIDLSTCEELILLTANGDNPAAHVRWAVRCDFFCRLHHRAIARLVDYGPFAGTLRFEAWRCGRPWRGARVDADRAVGLARNFLRANHLAPGECAPRSVREWHGRAVVLPDADAGCERRAGDTSGEIDMASCGMALIERRAVGAIGEMLADAGGGRVRAIAVWAEPGAGGLVIIGELARLARVNGFIPVCAEAIGTKIMAGVADRTLCIFDRRGRQNGWSDLVGGVLRSPKPHVLVYVGAHELPHARTLQLERVSGEALIAAVRPAVRNAAINRRLERAADRAGGRPGLFARALWGPAPVAHPALRVIGRSIAAEEPAVYGEPVGIVTTSVAEARVETGMNLIGRGRHAPGERSVRSAVAGLARRHDWDGAARGSLGLAGALLKRGRPADAQAVLADARTYAMKADGKPWLLRVATATGTAWLERGRLDEAESTLHAAYGMARALDDRDEIESSALALSRCLFWRGRYDEADAVLEPLDTDDRSAVSVRVHTLRSRVALGRGDLRRAIARATTAMDIATGLQDPAILAEAAAASALAHLRASDARGVERDVAMSVQGAHSSRDPLAALKARLILAEQQRRAGRPGAARLLTARSRRLTLPATLRGRLALVAELVSGSPVAAAVARHTSATGLNALALFAPVEGDPDHHANVAVHAAVDILQLCQAAEEEQAMLPRVCARIRERLDASGVAVYIVEGDSVLLMASDGCRIDSAVARRVISARQTLAPHQQDERLEGGAPVVFGGDLAGAVVARWTIGARPHPSQAEVILTMAATAVGPAVAAALARRRQAAATSLGELLGVSASMSDVRRAVDRAAPAPFAVLIEGESGSGKELVARALHRRSPRRDRPFCTLNCAALPEDLVESELFGHGRGAFTGAVAERPGVFEAAHTGTLFLDEIAELSPRAQAKILRTIQEGELRRVGENVPRRIDVRLVSATNCDLREEVAAHRFRLDLLYRLDVIRIVVPPLRDRPDDVAVLAQHIWREAAMRVGSRATLATATVAALARYHWPGNVRELQNVLAALAVRSSKRGVVPPTALPPPFGAASQAEACRLTDARRTFDEQFVRAALVRTGGHRGRAAEELGVSRQGLAKLLARLQIAE